MIFFSHLSDHEDVHAVELEAGDVVSHGVVGGVRRRALLRRSHAVLVVLDTVNHRQLGGRATGGRAREFFRPKGKTTYTAIQTVIQQRLNDIAEK